MKTTDRYQGAGVLELESREQKIVKEMLDMLSGRNYNEFITCADFDKPPSQERARFEELMHELFPDIEFNKKKTWHYKAQMSKDYQLFSHTNPGTALTLNPQIPLATSGEDDKFSYRLNGDIVIMVDRGCYHGSYVIDGPYEPSSLDDLASELGKKRDPDLRGVDRIRTPEHYGFKFYGVADLGQLKDVAQLYQRSAQIIARSRFTKQELDATRKAGSYANPELGTRKVNFEMYQEIIEGIAKEE